MGKVVIIGGGAAGMMAAVSAARSGDAVTLLEHTKDLGKKLLSTGNGRCNLTNRLQNFSFYRCSEKAFPEAALKKFSVSETLDFFHDLGLFFKEKDGYVYPRSAQASSVRNVFFKEMDRCHVDIRTEVNVKAICRQIGEDGRPAFLVKTADMSFAADSVILACGGMAAPVTGSDGSGYQLAVSLGHRLIPPVPALTGLKAPDSALKKASGVRTAGRVSLYIMRNGKKELAAFDTGEIQITDYGISGIPVFQVSRYAAKALYEGWEVSAEINFMPEYEKESLKKLWDEIFCEKKVDYDCLEILWGLVPEKLAFSLLKKAGIPVHFPVSKINIRQKEQLINLLSAFPLTVTESNPFSQAQVTAGGIDVRDVKAETMESKIVPGLYFAGEILDVDGICGGYNLQWAWTSGWLAGKQGRE